MHETETIPWTPVKNAPKGIFEKILSCDPDTGSYTRLIRTDPGVVSGPMVHDFYEEVFVVKGDVVDLARGITLNEGTYAYRHPGMKHGPFTSHQGSISFEVRAYTLP